MRVLGACPGDFGIESPAPPPSPQNPSIVLQQTAPLASLSTYSPWCVCRISPCAKRNLMGPSPAGPWLSLRQQRDLSRPVRYSRRGRGHPSGMCLCDPHSPVHSCGSCTAVHSSLGPSQNCPGLQLTEVWQRVSGPGTVGAH